jgi:transcription antitermination factor NusG
LGVKHDADGFVGDSYVVFVVLDDPDCTTVQSVYFDTEAQAKEFVAHVRAGISKDELAALLELPKLRLEPGMRVKVLQGPLQDQIGLLAALRPHERVLVLVQLLGGQQLVELARSSIEAMNP